MQHEIQRMDEKLRTSLSAGWDEQVRGRGSGGVRVGEKEATLLRSFLCGFDF